MQLIAKTLFGLEEVLADEIKELGAEDTRVVSRAVEFEGSKELMYNANYSLRTALSVLKPITSFRLRTAKDLYRIASRVDWTEHMSVNQTFSIVPVVRSSLFTHTGYAGLVLKDAIVDKFRSVRGKRPSVDTRDPDIIFNLRISELEVTISLDSSATPLYKRGYRIESTKAPINEVLAAGILRLSGWDGTKPFLDPMCGSGTFAIEAAMLAYNVPAGKLRKHFGFMNWNDFDSDLFESLKSTTIKEKSDSPQISCSDLSSEAVRVSIKNLKNVGLDRHVKVERSDFFESDSGGTEYTLMMNPPYGERLEEADIEDFYSKTGERLKHGYSGSEAWIISASNAGLKSVGLKPSKKYALYNGPLESKLVKYELFAGKRQSHLER